MSFSSSSSSDSANSYGSNDSNDSVIVEAGKEGPIENFFFRQCPAEFKLKITGAASNNVPKASLLQISHTKGIILFPNNSKGCLGYASIHELAEKESLKEEFLYFPGDESFILSLCLDSSERFAFVAKASNKLYSIDLAVEDRNKRPFISKIAQLERNAIEIISTKDFGLWVLLENGKIKNFTGPQLQEGKLEFKIDEPIGCISQIKENVMALGSKDSSKIHLIYFDSEIEIEEVQVPFDELECGSKGISSICLLPNGNSLLFSCKPENPEEDDVPLLLLENILEDGLKFSCYFDPCASRPPRSNQFYYLNAGKWSDNLVEFVILGNFASPDIGICGRMAEKEAFETFFIDNDEGLAQLPFINGEVTFPIGMALDFSSKTPLNNLIDTDAKDFPAAPILWVLTNSGHLCPFSMLKTDLEESVGFMRTVPLVSFDETAVSDINPNLFANTTNSAALASTPQTPSKVPHQQLASLQKSTEIKQFAQDSPTFKPAPSEKKSETTTRPAPVFFQEPEPPVLIKKEEKMESLSVGPYQSILLTEIAATHAAMQEDIFTLKQLSLKNSLLLRQNSQKYFNSLESLESYAGSLEKLLKSSENVFSGVKDKVEVLKFSLNELMGKSQQVKGNWMRIKQDRKINWDSRLRTLTMISEELFQRIDRLRNFLSNPIEAAKYRATLKSFVDSAQEKVQILMAQISGLFVASPNEDNSEFYADLEALDLNSGFGMASCDNLLSQLNVLSLNNGNESISKSENRNKSLLNAVKSRGSRLLIPSRITATSVTTEKALKLSAEDESLISSFVSAIKLTEEVPEFAEIAVMAKLSINENDSEVPITKATETKEAPKPVQIPAENGYKPSSSAFEFSAEPAAFSFNAPSKLATAPKLSESPKPASDIKLPTFNFDISSSAEAMVSKPLEFKPAPLSPVDNKPFKYKFPSSTSSLPTASPVPSSPSFSFAPATSNEPKVSSFSFKQPAEPKSEVPVSSTSATKIPSIFTVTPLTATKESAPLPTDPVSVLKSESPLPTFDSLDFGGKPSVAAVASTNEIKPFPSIFGVKPAEEVKAPVAPEIELEESKTYEAKTSVTPETPEIKAPEAKTPVAPEIKATEAPSPSSGFSFSFKPSEPNKPPVNEIVQASIASPITPSQPAIQSQPFSFSFAPPSTGFSITTKPSFPSATTAPISGSIPTFGTTTAPTFGSTSIPTSTTVPTFGNASVPTFGSTSVPTFAPAFGQTSLPSAGAFAGALNNSTGFAAFAATPTNKANFSAFANNNPNPSDNNTSGTLTFASFLPADKKPQDSPSDNNPPTKPFSFSGFRE